MSNIRGYSKAIVNDGEPLRCEWEITHEWIRIDSLGPEANKNWSFVDSRGHFHAYNKANGNSDNYPTLKAESIHVPCDGACGDEFGCEGYYRTEYTCRICAEVVEPGLTPGPHSTSVPGRSSWTVVVYGYQGRGDDLIAGPASVRIVDAGGVEYFGIAAPDRFDFDSVSGSRTGFVGVSPLGSRTTSSKPKVVAA